jgi:RNA polymerase sigma factor (TIGR02999 family)
MTRPDPATLSGEAGFAGSLTSQRLLPLMYEKLRRLAASKMFRESGLQTLQPTALVHEAWLRLVTSKSDWDSQAHFFGAAAEAMRRVLVDRSRTKAAIKRQVKDDASTSINGDHSDRNHILVIHEALKRLGAEDPNAAEIVALKFFSGFTSEEIASMSSQSVRSVERQWTFAKARLFQIVRDDIENR